MFEVFNAISVTFIVISLNISSFLEVVFGNVKRLIAVIFSIILFVMYYRSSEIITLLPKAIFISFSLKISGKIKTTLISEYFKASTDLIVVLFELLFLMMTHLVF